MKNRNPKWLIIWLLSALSCLAQPLLVEGVPSPVPASANGIYERQSTGWAKGTEWRIARAGSYWTLDQYVDGAWSIGSVLSANQSPSPWAAPWPGGMSVTLADPGTIGSAGGGAITDPGTIGAPGVQPSIDPFLRPYPQNLSEEQKAAVLENLGILNPDELNALLESFAKPPRTALDVLDSADHLYFLSEAGNTIFDAKGDLNLTVTGTISDAAFDPFFDTSRAFTDNNRADSSEDLATNGNPYWGVVGFSVDSVTGQDQLISSSDETGNPNNFQLYRVGNSLRFRVIRFGTELNFDEVSLEGLEAGESYIAVFRADGTNIRLAATGLGEALDDNSLSLTASTFPLRVGFKKNSSLDSNNFWNGEIGLVGIGFGQLSDSDTKLLLSAKSVDFRSAHKAIRGIGAWGDSLTTTSFAPEPWPMLLAAAAGGYSHTVNGIGGQNSTEIRARMEATPLENLRVDTLVVWAGNNNSSARQGVVDDVSAMVDRGLLAGCRQVLIFGLPNRSGFNSTSSVISDLQTNLDFCNAGFQAKAASDERIKYVDLHEAFINPANYSPLDGNDSSDQNAGIVPRSARDTPASPNSTHLGNPGTRHISSTVLPIMTQ